MTTKKASEAAKALVALARGVPKNYSKEERERRAKQLAINAAAGKARAASQTGPKTEE